MLKIKIIRNLYKIKQGNYNAYMVNKERLVQTFLYLVKIDSPSGEEKDIVAEVMKRLQALGAEVQNDSYGNVIAKIAGEGEPFMLNAHLDTVEPGRGIKPVIEGDVIKTDGTTILGGDPKAGVTAILEALTSAKEDGKKLRNLEFVFTLGEETGLYGAINLDYTKVTAKTGATFDGEEAVSNVDVEAPGMVVIDAIITGKAAHAGVEPEKGISSIQIASEIVTKLQIGRIDDETTSNIGTVQGGNVRNSVPEITEIRGEMRSRDKEKLAKLQAQWKEVFETVMKQYSDAKLDLSMQKDGEAYKLDPNRPIMKEAVKALEKIGLKPNYIKSGGLTDVNIFALHDMEVVVIGAGAHAMHTKQETVIISEMLQAAQFAEQLIIDTK